ncbi:MAG: HesB/IscA family protein [Candidatus Methylomirabilales bacterium]|nr:iron-sulfur cluster assembly accessory protein [candidate division NC10 bacterium]MCH7897329.1 iron-sulfur cluster assembly accessory protein [candidate division NC10 bacterium]MCZ6549969.1 iron-sulfur cluster assembly accessory protein [candidate division NC10 bacterium]
MITVTATAVAKLKDLMAKDGVEGQGLRVRVRGGGCSGYEYQLAFDTPKEGDQVFEEGGVKVVVDPKSLLFLAGTEIDFQDGLTGTGFAIKNPNSKGSCGCGQSFQA